VHTDTREVFTYASIVRM